MVDRKLMRIIASFCDREIEIEYHKERHPNALLIKNLEKENQKARVRIVNEQNINKIKLVEETKNRSLESILEDLKEKIKTIEQRFTHLKLDEQKLGKLAEYRKKENLNIIGVVETNFEVGYRSFWSSKEEEKRKGSDIELAVLQVWVVYLSVLDKEIVKRTQRSIIEGICANKRIDIYNIVLDNFNTIVNPELDSNNSNLRNQDPGYTLLT
ncbi:31493_t:CDS:2 [Gigaspora margarita]|uniref:31493_t:CDS:1 n=1 Tax=Gigaspora margarita TaxID=4874 RepID=A0ABM8VZW1_GIGMA|nr:31493_t:CDS:2 [Gigaspora margarita]